MITGYLVHLLILIGIYSIVNISLQLALGYTGLLNLGHIAFYAIGAYTSALLALNGLPFLPSMLLGGFVAMISGFLIEKDACSASYTIWPGLMTHCPPLLPQ